jgi:hypothetical protein
MDPLVAKYLGILNEDTVKSCEVKNAVPSPGSDFFGTQKSETIKDQTKNVDVETPEEDKDNSVDEKESEPKEIKTKSESVSNPFDELYNKILKEETFGWAIEDESSDSEEESPFAPASEDKEESEKETEEEEEGLEAVLSFMKKAVAALEKLVDEADDEDENEDENEDEETVKEEVDAEALGHALVDQEKLTMGLTSKSNVVKGAVDVSKKKAEVPATGKDYDGELEKQPQSSCKDLCGKNNKVDGVKLGNLFNNK